MLGKIRIYLCTHRIKYKVNSLTTSLFCRWYEIAVTGNEDHTSNLFFESHRRNIKAYAHIYSFLFNVKKKIRFFYVLDIQCAVKQLFLSISR